MSIAMNAEGKSLASWSPWTHRPTECLMVGLWFWATAKEFGGQTFVLYALTAYFVAGSFIHWRHTRVTLMLAWPLLLLPAWSILSTVWSGAPVLSFKLGLQHFLSVLICAYAATRLSRRDVVAAIFISLTYFALLSIPHLRDGGDLQGVFPEKNSLASRMSILGFAGAVIFLDSRFPRALRWASAPVAALSVVLLAATHSATSIVTAALGVVLIIAFAMVWRPARGFRALIVSGVALVVLLAALAVSGVGGFDPESSLFSAFGKDPTLTGRTELWAFAKELIAMKPALGVGSGAFWRPDVIDAQSLLDLFYKPRGTTFSFHNSYLELSVQLGLIGLALGLAGLIWTLWVNIRQFSLELPAPAAFFIAMTMVALTRSFVESDLWRQFELVQMTVWIGAMFAVLDIARRRQQNLENAASS